MIAILQLLFGQSSPINLEKPYFSNKLVTNALKAKCGTNYVLPMR